MFCFQFKEEYKKRINNFFTSECLQKLAEELIDTSLQEGKEVAAAFKLALAERVFSFFFVSFFCFVAVTTKSSFHPIWYG